MQYKARFGCVWQRKADKKVFGNLIALEKGETVTDYAQITKPKKEEKQTEKPIENKKESAK